MLAFPSMLVAAAQEAGIKVPEGTNDAIDKMKFDREKFPHFFAYVVMQVGRPCRPMGCHSENAKVIAQIPEEKIRTVTPAEILGMGFV